MFRKTLNLSYYKFCSNCLSTNRWFSSQIVKTNVELSKSEEQKSVNSFENNENMSKGLTQLERQELAKVVKSPVQMDFYWENKLVEKPVKRNKFSDGKGGISVDFMALLAHKFDFSIDGIKRRIKYWISFRELYNQRYITKRHAILGPELATAHFVVYRGGKVRFRHAPKSWFTDCEQMPNVYDNRFRLTAVDASNVKLRFESLDNFCILDSLEELNLSKNQLLDDFVCDKIARLFRNSKNLSILDLSDNPLISHRGIEALHRIRSLKKLIITGTKAANYPFIQLVIILFNDVNPNCEIII